MDAMTEQFNTLIIALYLEVISLYNVSMPIVEEVNKILYENKSAADAVNDLMLRDGKIEIKAKEWE